MPILMKKYGWMPVIVGIAFFIRIIALNQSLWADEGTTARVIHEYSLLNIPTHFSLQDFHPPFYYMFMKIWCSLFGSSEIALRMPSVLFSLAAGYVIFLIGTKLFSKIIGSWAALLFLFNPLIIYYSQEARMYMMMVFFLSVAILSFTKINEPNSKTRDIVLFNLAVFLSFITFYGSLFLILTFYVYLLGKRKYNLCFKVLPGFLTAIVLLSPLLMHQIINSRVALSTVHNWSQVLGNLSIKNLVLIPVKFSVGRVSFYPKMLYWALSLVQTAFIYIFFTKGIQKNKMLATLSLLPLVLGILFSLVSPLLQYFRFIYLLIPMALIIIAGTKYSWQRSILVGGSLFFSLLYLLIPQFHREDWKDLAYFIPKNSIIYTVPSSVDALRYYRSDLKIQDFTKLGNQKSIQIIPYTFEIYGYQYQTQLRTKGYTLNKEYDYRGVKYEIWKKTL